MSSEFEAVKIGDFIEVTDYVANGSFASLKENVEYKESPDYAVLVRLADHNSGWAGDRVYVSKRAYTFLKKSFVLPGDVIISNVGANAGTVFRAPDLGQPMTLGPNSVLLRPKEDKPFAKDYIFYFFASPKGQFLLKSLLSGSAQPKFNKTDLRNADIDVPIGRDYKFFAEPLLNLDLKIKLNRQINQTLEQIAQTIFKSWFVDFEPVNAKIEAKAAGRDPERAAMCAISGKLEAELDQLPTEQYQQLAATAALFPDELVEIKLGVLPMGWGMKSIADISKFATGKIGVSALSIENYISTENMLENRGGVCRAASLPSVPTVPSFSKGQVLISNIRPYFKKIWLANFDGGRSNDVLAFSAKENDSPEFLYNLLYQDEFFEFMMRTSKGAKMPRGDKVAIAGWKFPCPGHELRSFFSEKVRPFYSYIERLNAEVEHLSLKRDTLLPKLLSGELSVENQFQEAAE